MSQETIPFGGVIVAAGVLALSVLAWIDPELVANPNAIKALGNAASAATGDRVGDRAVGAVDDGTIRSSWQVCECVRYVRLLAKERDNVSGHAGDLVGVNLVAVCRRNKPAMDADTGCRAVADQRVCSHIHSAWRIRAIGREEHTDARNELHADDVAGDSAAADISADVYAMRARMQLVSSQRELGD